MILFVLLTVLACKLKSKMTSIFILKGLRVHYIITFTEKKLKPLATIKSDPPGPGGTSRAVFFAKFKPLQNDNIRCI